MNAIPSTSLSPRQAKGNKFPSKEDIYSSTNNGADIFKHYCPDWDGNPKKKISSPFREDKKPSCQINMNTVSGKYEFHDYGSGVHFAAIDFVMELKGLEFTEALEVISNNLCLTDSSAPCSPVNIIHTPKPSDVKPFSIKRRLCFNNVELAFLAQYKITPIVLEKYKVSSLESFTRGAHTIHATPENPIFCYQITENCFKLYRPSETNKAFKFQWLGEKPSGFVFGLDQVPEKCENLIITAGEKDVLSLASLGVNAITLNSETASLPQELFDRLKAVATNIIVLYDTDGTGLAASKKLCEQYGLIRWILPETLKDQGGKDISDYVKLGLDINANDIIPESFAANEVFNPMLNIVQEKTTEKEAGFSMSVNYQIQNTVPAITLRDTQLINIGEIMTLVALPGTGKSMFCELLFAIVIANIYGLRIDQIQFNTNIPEGKGVLLIDTERPTDDCKRSFDRICKRLNLDQNKHLIDSETGEFKNGKYVCMVDIPTVKERKEALTKLLSSGKFGLVIIDGALDLCLDMNKIEECSELVGWLRMLANKHQFSTVVTMHPNKGSEVIAGHLGAFLYRYSRAVLLIRVNKNDKDIKEVTNLFEQGKTSHGGGDLTTYFRYCTDEKLIVSVEDAPIKNGKSSIIQSTVQIIFNEYAIKGQSRIPSGELKKRVSELTGKGLDTAKNYLSDAVELGYIHIEGNGKSTMYSLNSIG
jgi:hypothetical protein